MDSTIVRAHQHAAGAGKRGPGREPAVHAIGRSRGGLTAKVHLAANARCRPLAFVLTAGQAGDAPPYRRQWPTVPCASQGRVVASGAVLSGVAELREAVQFAVDPIAHGRDIGIVTHASGPGLDRLAALDIAVVISTIAGRV